MKPSEANCTLEERRGEEKRVLLAGAKDSQLTEHYLPVKDNFDGWYIPKKYLNKLHSTFPRIDIKSELQKIQLWLDSNPTKQKTSKGMTRFLNSWFTRANDNLPLEAPPVRVEDLPKAGKITIQEKKWHDGE